MSARYRFARRLQLSAALVALLIVLLPWPAFATLGEPETSVQADSLKLEGSHKAADHGTYRVHEIQLPGGTLVREYAGSDGNVFAVTWHGPFMPDLRQTLGRYFEAYVAAAKAKQADHHRHLKIEQSDLVVEASGHMHAFAGRAYLPQAIPGGVVVEDLP